MGKEDLINRHSEDDSPKNRNSTELHHDCHCEECRVIPLSCFSGEEQFQHEFMSVRNCGEVKTVKHKTNLSAILKLTPFVKNSSSPANAGEGKMRTPWAAFTLAEVLITLTIIGVIAALTIPNLMRKWEDQHTVSAVKEAYSILNNAIKMAVAENGPVEEWNWPDRTTNRIANQNANYIIDMLKPYLKFSKICYSASGCMGAGNYKNLNGNDISWGGEIESNVFGKAVLSNGMSVAFANIGYGPSATKTYWKITTDINGKKGPNRYGYDVFKFNYTSNKLIGFNDYGSLSNYCNINSNGDVSGASCSVWILKHNNVDYKYRDVSAEW